MFQDEYRDPSEVREAVLQRFVRDPEQLRTRYLGLAARDRRARERIAQLEEELRRSTQAADASRREADDLRRRLADAHGALVAFRRETARLKSDLRRVRGSTTMRVGRALLAPAQGLVRLSRRRERPEPAPDEDVRPARADTEPSSTPDPVAGQGESAPRGSASARPRPRSGLSLDELYRRFDVGHEPEDLHALLSRLWFHEGEIRRARDLVGAHPEVVGKLPPKGRTLAAQVLAASRVLDGGLAVPPRSEGAAYVVERRRVLYCVHSTPAFDSNGYSIRTGGVAQGLRANGIDVVAVARSAYPWDAHRKGSLPALRREVRTVAGVDYVHNPGLALADATIEQYLDQTSDTILREARRARPEVVHAASDATIALPALIAARRAGVPFVYEVRGLWEVTAASAKPGWDSTERYQLQVALETLVATEADAVLAITPQVADVLVARGVDPSRIHLMPNAVDVGAVLPLPRDTSYPRASAVRRDVPVIGFAGSLVHYEGLDLLVRAAALLRDRGRAMQVVIAGSGAAEPEIRSLVAELQLDGVVHLLGRVPNDEIPRLISLFDIMPCPRRSLPVTELVSPLKPLEAFAAAKAVLLSDVAPHRDLSGDDQERALLVRPDDVEALAEGLETLLDDPELRRRLGRAARLWTGDERTWQKVTAAASRAYVQAQEAHARAAEGRELSELRVGLVADEFTTSSLRGSVTVVPLSVDQWRSQLDGERLDLVLLESAWKGNGGQWTRRIGYYSDDEHAVTRRLIAECRRRGIPVVFWNKEDPVHTQRFLRTARLCDVILTVDANLVPMYRAEGAPSLRAVGSLPFFAQPAIHHPVRGDRPVEQSVAYAGTYYGARYPDRSAALDRMLRAARDFGLAIYDRQLNEKDSPYRFPDTYQRFVRGGLPYEEVVETYRAHLAHLNVNSVTDSPTMFSRRVVEIAASGGVVLSSASRGITEALGDAVPASNDGEELAAWLELWSTDPAARRREAWHQMRAIHRSHTAASALVLMARTAGIPVRATVIPPYTLVTPKISDALAATLRQQSVLPQEVVVTGPLGEDLDSAASLREMGVTVTYAHEPKKGWPEWVGLAEAGVPRTYYEDLLLLSRGGRWDRLEPAPADRAPEVTDLAWPSTGSGASRSGLVRSAVLAGSRDAAGVEEALDGARRRLAVVLAEPPTVEATTAQPDVGRGEGAPDGGPDDVVTGTRSQTVLVAGHDLKFLRGALRRFEDTGVRLLVDEWESHTAHDEARSRELLASADAVLCEWGLGNAVWYSRNVQDEQRLTVRVHSQELFTPHLRRIDHLRVNAYVFVSELVRQAAVASHGLPAERTLLIPNMVDTESLRLTKSEGAGKTIGMVGVVPMQKRLDVALDVLEAVREHDPAYRLRIKGRLPEEYPWLASRPDELAYYEAQFARIERLGADFPGSISLDPHGDDMAEWYRGVGTVLSVSNFESFHLTIADGVASGARPAVLYWPGADLVYPREWISASVDELVAKILSGRPEVSSEAVAHLSESEVARDLLDAVLGEDGR